MSVASSFRNRALPPRTVVFGEVGLGGEVRSSGQAALRVREGVALQLVANHVVVALVIGEPEMHDGVRDGRARWRGHSSTEKQVLAGDARLEQ